MKTKTKKTRTERTMTIDGIGDLIAFVARGGQDALNRSDLISVNGALALPLDKEFNLLHKKLQFGERCAVLSQNLTCLWGEGGDSHPEITGRPLPQHRIRTCYATATTWKEAFAQVDAHLDREIAKIVDVVETRRKALADAENDD